MSTKIKTTTNLITYPEFKEYALYFLEKSRQLKINWQWCEEENLKHNKTNQGYLKLIQINEIEKLNINEEITSKNIEDDILNDMIIEDERINNQNYNVIK